jgi:hypothetical protein
MLRMNSWQLRKILALKPWSLFPERVQDRGSKPWQKCIRKSCTHFSHVCLSSTLVSMPNKTHFNRRINTNDWEIDRHTVTTSRNHDQRAHYIYICLTTCCVHTNDKLQSAYSTVLMNTTLSCSILWCRKKGQRFTSETVGSWVQATS